MVCSVFVFNTHTSFTRIFQSQKDENWSLPVLFSVSLDLRLFANSADIQAVKKSVGKPGERLEKAAELLMGCFRVCASDNRAAIEESKKWGMLNIVNQLFKIYFKINKLHLCKPLIRAIDSLVIKDKFSLPQLITFRYYVGRKAMFDSDFKSAEEYLMFAFERCHKSSRKNKRLILIYLIPVKMLLGHMPKLSLLKKYDLLQFAEVAKAVSSGNLLQLNESLEKNEAFFIKCGIYLILEKLKVITFRNLFKKVYLINNKTHLLPIDEFTTVLKLMEMEDIDVDETQCIIANLFFFQMEDIDDGETQCIIANLGFFQMEDIDDDETQCIIANLVMFLFFRWKTLTMMKHSALLQILLCFFFSDGRH
ncbi:PCI domain-containing protein 2-like isoform X1 [Gigantopelta aegis]|uniref:PCI domain-containing protein 2-like isoform X1 n=1 Tax=Gigantopelta aegis TaxID=1735272 RepID=UPI001B88CA84|nr:PCI domain-containing protein 2-like isoform X1 [Gigantopelta aegis]